MQSPKIVLIGDTIVDVNVYGSVLGISAETPTMVMRSDREIISLGGAAFVFRNLVEMGSVWTIFITDSINHEALPGWIDICDGSRKTEKRRFWANGYKLFQVDVLPGADVEPWCVGWAIDIINKDLGVGDLLIFSDYRHGLLTESFARQAISLAKECGATVMVDSQVSQKPSNHNWYVGADYVFVNERELGILNQTGITYMFRNIVAKHGPNGAELFGTDVSPIKSITHHGFRVDAVDTCGAGDAFLAAFAWAMLRHGDEEKSLAWANRWAAEACRLPGTSTPQIESVLDGFEWC